MTTTPSMLAFSSFAESALPFSAAARRSSYSILPATFSRRRLPLSASSLSPQPNRTLLCANQSSPSSFSLFSTTNTTSTNHSRFPPSASRHLHTRHERCLPCASSSFSFASSPTALRHYRRCYYSVSSASVTSAATSAASSHDLEPNYATTPSQHNQFADSIRRAATTQLGATLQHVWESVRFDSGAYIIPHPEKAHKGGEDAYFISLSGRVIGVADGVGGWGEVGVDPGLFSRTLMSEAQKIADEAFAAGIEPTPSQVLEEAFELTKGIEGSSTATVLLLASDNKLHYSSVGDSGFLIIRDGEIIFRSEEQQHDWNQPYQLGTGSDDTVAEAVVGSVDVKEDDIIILASDGLFDNLYEDEILDLVAQAQPNPSPANGSSSRRDEHAYPPRWNAKSLAEALASEAHKRAAKSEGRVPFGEEAGRYGVNYIGGKMDDISVIVSRVHLTLPVAT
ncbi:PPM-type phosphatase domain-containing protein [Balamuthia mandrillaris]